MRSALKPDGEIFAVPCTPEERLWEDRGARLHDMLDRAGSSPWDRDVELILLHRILTGDMGMAQESPEWYTATDPEEGILARNKQTSRQHGREAQDTGVVRRRWWSFLSR